MDDVKRILKEFAKNVFFMYSSLHRQLHFLSLYVLQAVLVRVLLFLQQTALFLHPSAKHYQHTLIATSLQLRYIIALVVPLIHLTVNASSFLYSSHNKINSPIVIRKQKKPNLVTIITPTMNSSNINTIANKMIAVDEESTTTTTTMTMINITSNNPSSQSAFNNNISSNNNKKRKMMTHHYHQEVEEEEEEDSDNTTTYTTTTRTLQCCNHPTLLLLSPPKPPVALLPFPSLKQEGEEEEEEEEEGSDININSGNNNNVRDYLREQLVTSFPSTLHLILRFESFSATDDDNIDNDNIDYEDYDEFDGNDVDSDIVHPIEEDDNDNDEIEIDNTTTSINETIPLLPVIIGWCKDGKSFLIYDEERFVNEMMSQYFLCGYNSAEQNFQTFQQMLDLWGFTITTTTTHHHHHHHSSSSGSGIMQQSYYDVIVDDDYDPSQRQEEDNEDEVAGIQHICSHPLFIRDDPDAIQQMKLFSM